jgi:hypothetical protein
MADYNTILREDEIANLDPKKLDEATKKFQNVAYGITRDVTPVVGELQSYKYALEDAQALAKAARGEEGYEDMTPIEALGYVGLTALGVAGTIPFVGPVFRSAQKGIRALMPKRGPRTLEPLQPMSAAESAEAMQNFRRRADQDPGFNYFVANLPEYRQRPENFATNYREYMAIPEDQRQAFTNVATNPVLRQASAMEPVMARSESVKQTLINQENYNAKVTANSSKALTIPREPLTFGKGLRANRDGTVKEYLGSVAFDEISKSGNEVATAQQWLGFLKGLRNKGIKSEELSDSGLVMFKGDQAVGGDIFRIAQDSPDTKITKGEILAALETNPTYRLKIRDYNYPINTEEVLNTYPTFARLSKDVDSMILSKITEMEDIAARSNLNKVAKTLANDRMNFNDLAARLSTTKNNLSYLKQTRTRLNEALDSFNDNEKLMVRSLIDEYDKAISIAERAVKTTEGPRHRGTFPGGGYDYREKVLYLNENIPGNSNPKKVWSVHFNEPNAVTFVRYDTRGVDNYGDTYFMVELQSDPHQTLSKEGSRHFKSFKEEGSNIIDPKEMVRKNPYGRKLTSNIKKREVQDLLDEIQEYNKIVMDRPLSPPEFDRLGELNKQLKIKEAELQRAPARSGEARPSDDFGSGSIYDYENKSYDYFPMGNENTWVKSNIKSLVSDARKNNKRYIALAPADFFQLGKNNKQKIEQFYGLGGDKLPAGLQRSPESGKIFTNAKGEGFGKYRDYKTGQLKGTAVVPKAMQDVADEIGAKVITRKVYHSDPQKPYKIFDTENNVPMYAFKKKYEMDEFYDNIDSRSNLEKLEMDGDDPRNFVQSIVIDLQGSSKGKMKGYKIGGLVEVDRSNFAPLF